MGNSYSITRMPEAVRRLFRVSHSRSANFYPQNAMPAIDCVRNDPPLCGSTEGRRGSCLAKPTPAESTLSKTARQSDGNGSSFDSEQRTITDGRVVPVGRGFDVQA